VPASGTDLSTIMSPGRYLQYRVRLDGTGASPIVRSIAVESAGPVGITSPIAAGPDPRIVITPNPLPGHGTIAFSPGRDASGAELRIVDVGGRVVRRFDVGPGADRRTVDWDGRDGAGRPLPSGVYYVQLRTGMRTAARPAVLVR
jgi:hypothetical protein